MRVHLCVCYTRTAWTDLRVMFFVLLQNFNAEFSQSQQVLQSFFWTGKRIDWTKTKEIHHRDHIGQWWHTHMFSCTPVMQITWRNQIINLFRLAKTPAHGFVCLLDLHRRTCSTCWRKTQTSWYLENMAAVLALAVLTWKLNSVTRCCSPAFSLCVF